MDKGRSCIKGIAVKDKFLQESIKVGKETLVVTSECDCKKNVALVGRTLPEYTDKPHEALTKAIKYIEGKNLYWAIHLKQKHVLDVKDKDGTSYRWRK